MTLTAPRLDHLALPVFDVAGTYRFYREVMQLQLLQTLSGDDWGGFPWLMMIFAAGDGRQLVLCGLRGARPPGDDGLPRDVRHLAFSVADRAALDEWRRRLEGHGIAVSPEDHGAQQSLYFSDPNGITLEITTPASQGAITADPDAAAQVAAWLAQSG